MSLNPASRNIFKWTSLAFRIVHYRERNVYNMFMAPFDQTCPACGARGQLWNSEPEAFVCPRCSLFFSNFGVLLEVGEAEEHDEEGGHKAHAGHGDAGTQEFWT